MKEKTKDYIHNSMLILSGSIVLLMCIRHIGEVQNLIAWDELGYWGNAAFIAGYDWSDIVSHFSGYYSYGYSVILAGIIMSCGGTTALAYKLAVLLNGLFITSTMYIAYGVGRFYFGRAKRNLILIAAFVVSMYANNITQSNFAWTECLLIFLYWVLVGLFTSLQKKFSIMKCSAIAIIAVYMYIVHPRTIGILIAVIITIVISFAIRKVALHKVIISTLAIGLFFLVCYMYRQMIKANVYIAKEDIELTNTVAAVAPWILSKLNLIGIVEMIKTFFNRFFYWGCTTYLLFFFCLKALIGSLIKKCKNKNFESCQFFLLLSMLGIFGVMTLQLSQSGTVQALLYGRYQDIIIGPFFFLGILYFVRECEKCRKITVIQICCYSFGLYFISMVISSIPIYKEYFVPNCNVEFFPYLIDELVGYELNRPILIAISGCTAVFLIKLLHENYRVESSLLVMVIIIMYVHSKYQTSEQCFQKTFSNYMEMNGFYQEVQEICAQEEQVYYYHSDFGASVPLAMWLQFSLCDKPVKIITSMEAVDSGMLFVPRRINGDRGFLPVTEIDLKALYADKYLALYQIE